MEAELRILYHRSESWAETDVLKKFQRIRVLTIEQVWENFC